LVFGTLATQLQLGLDSRLAHVGQFAHLQTASSGFRCRSSWPGHAEASLLHLSLPRYAPTIDHYI
jgi:hypothetical protein